MDAGRFVAIGDSFTEGVGDPHLHYPNGYRGWADRMARQLGRTDPAWEYANLALRSKRIDQVLDEQLGPALALRPTLASFFAGGNDLLALRSDVDAVLTRFEEAVGALAGGGATVVVMTVFDPRLSSVLEPLNRRARAFNAGIREIADDHDAVVVDHARLRIYDDRRLWAPDKLHMSRWGHKRMAAAVLRELGLDHSLRLRSLAEAAPRTPWRVAAVEEARFVRTEVLPLVHRRVTGRSSADTAEPKWPEPIRPADGMKRLARTRGHVATPR
ncbi:SGNH/GDSL hydrolase family protein [Phycicoccus sp. CSK15P-2]|uniref:SGNH/GDSL hydrolase family protein n=1 Tax=Phycicoccus sp. CSK15P-2 TaxID=2807627 RepID=UPI001951C03F|nr:SGNH/GDSL hydrolase family protein [Phycicoccus sp. CSK15P-2]MBM6404427.1 SGNH/GDSL hydrolase family protein [Phycicoccus sp. CSK15P-2]